jgi:hypothetical protein
METFLPIYQTGRFHETLIVSAIWFQNKTRAFFNLQYTLQLVVYNEFKFFQLLNNNKNMHYEDVKRRSIASCLLHTTMTAVTNVPILIRIHWCKTNNFVFNYNPYTERHGRSNISMLN